MTLALRGEKLSRTFSSAAGDVHACVDIDIEVAAGELVVVRGASGAGKTTLLNLLGGLDTPTSGSVWIGDVEATALDEDALAALRRERLGFVFQSFGLIPILSAAENVELPLRIAKTPPAERDARVAEALKLVGLADHAAQRPTELSGGQQQRVGVARALAVDPNILLMDEPFGAVDPIVRRELQTETIRLQRELAKTIVFVTHDIDEAFLLGDQVVILEKGARVAQIGTPDEIIENPASEFVADFIGVERGTRALHAKPTARGTVLVDAAGRAQGVLVEDSA